MAKLHPRKTGVRKGLHFRKIASYVDVARVPYGRGLRTARGPFVACVKVGSGGARFIATKPLASCASGRNPRAAIAAALRKAATASKRRRGAFAGLGRR